MGAREALTPEDSESAARGDTGAAVSVGSGVRAKQDNSAASSPLAVAVGKPRPQKVSDIPKASPGCSPSCVSLARKQNHANKGENEEARNFLLLC